jgi:hypothetical protein
MKHLKSFKVFESYEEDNLSEIVRGLKNQGLNVQTEELEEYRNRIDIPKDLPIRISDDTEKGAGIEGGLFKEEDPSTKRFVFEIFNTRITSKIGGTRVLGELTYDGSLDDGSLWLFTPADIRGNLGRPVPVSNGKKINYDLLFNEIKKLKDEL